MSDTHNSIADALYGAPAAAAHPPAQAAPTAVTPASHEPAQVALSSEQQEADQQALADSLYDKPAADIKPTLPREVAALRAAEDNGPYSRIGGYDSVPMEAALEGIDLPAETLTAVATEYRHMAVDLGASADQASQLLATAQGLISDPLTPEQSAKMQGEAAELVVAQYGEDATQMLDLAKRLVARDPRIKQMLDRSGAGNHPRTVMTLIELAVQQRSRGRLK